MSTADELAKLVALRDQGVLSDEEFQAEKARLLGSSSSEGPPESPPGFVASPPVPPVPPTGSPATAGGGGAKKPGGFALTGKQVLIGLVVLAVIGAGTGLGIALTGGSTPAGATEVFLQPTNAQGQHPFTPNLGTDASVPPTVSGASNPTSGTTLASYSGNSVGLYGGTMDLASCDIQQMITYLEANPSKASAWAAAERIPVGQISTYINGLTPMTLRYDTRVTNHGYVNGVANAIPEILQAGQAVLVDSYGVPRARCYCGNPLTPPIAVSGSPRYVGPQWSRFSPTTAIVVQQSTTIINNFTLINNSTGQAFSRPVRTAGTSDAPAPTCTGPSMPGVTVCTNPTITAVERAACSAIGAQDAQGDRCAFQSMHVSTVSPEWVFVQGLGFYSGNDQPPSVQEARSDLDELILDLRTGRLIGPTNIGFCHVTGTNASGPDLSAVPSSVLAGWGLQPCGAGTSTSVTAPVPSSAPPSTAPSSSSTSTAVASEFTVWSGSWGAHEQTLEIGPTGTGHLTYADLTLCPTCSFGGAPRGTMDFELTSVTADAANGAVTASSDPQNYTVGQVVTVRLAAGAPGQLLELSVAGRGGPWNFCNSTSAGQCGA
jgi:Short C-terminal domain